MLSSPTFLICSFRWNSDIHIGFLRSASEQTTAVGEKKSEPYQYKNRDGRYDGGAAASTFIICHFRNPFFSS